MSAFFTEVEVVAPSESFAKTANVKNYQLYEYAGKNRIAFWEGCAETLHWYKKWHTVLDWDPPFSKWFEGGKLNACYNCLDRHMGTDVENKVAFYFEKENGASYEITYKQLYEKVNQLASLLKKWGVKKKDCVAIYLPLIPEAVISMLACARVGATHTVVFGGFSAEALRSRIIDANAKVLITADGSIRKEKKLVLKATADEAIDKLTCIEKVLVVKNEGFSIPMQEGRDYFYQDEIEKADPFCPCEVMEAEDPLFILYTSGTTGKPKGIVHATGGYLVGAAITAKLVFDLKPEDVFWCTADVGWITGHTYVVYGPLVNGVTQVMYEGSLDKPEKDRTFSLIEKYGVNIFYTAPTAVRLFMKWGEEIFKDRDLSSLRLLGSVGEPLNPEAWLWYYRAIGKEKCPIVDTWWQTETGSIMITSMPGLLEMKPGSVAKPFPGIDARVLDDYGNEAEAGYLAILSPWPSMMRGIHGDTRRFVQTYWNKWGGRYYFSGDGALVDADGYFWISGRVDDTLNVSAHRIGTMEVESALVEHQSVAEAAVVGIPDEITGQAIVAFVILKDRQIPTEALRVELQNLVVKKIGGIARPKTIFFTTELPKTRSGKIMRRLLRDLAHGRELGDTTTLENERLIEILEVK